MKTLFTFLLLFCSLMSFSQAISFDSSISPDEMITDFFNSDLLTVSNITFSDEAMGIAFFDAGDSELAVNAGIVFTTGDIDNINNASDVLASGENGSTFSFDDDIAYASSIPDNFDNVFIEFDLVSSIDTMFSFSYLFGSEEYPEFVGSTFNDAFLFLVSGEGLDGVYSNNAVNTAMVPNSPNAVTINNVNEMMNAEYYIDNSDDLNFVLDGHTVLLPADFEVQAGEIYHVKIILADVGDSSFDSAIFLGYNSLGNNDSLVPPAEFSLTQSGNMIDFVNASKYATSYFWDFGNDVTSTERYPESVEYTQSGNYEVSLTTTNYCCSSTFTATVSVALSDLSLSVFVSNPVSCFGGSDAAIVLTAVGGNGPYVFSATPEITDFNQVSAGTYVISVVDQDGQITEETIVIDEPAELLLQTVVEGSVEGQNTGSALVDVEGGTLPYTYFWSNNDMEKEINDLAAGDYTVTVTDANGCEKTETITVQSLVSNMETEGVKVSITPNPVRNVVDIKGIAGKVDIAYVVTLNGSRVELHVQETTEGYKAEVADLVPGIYTIILRDIHGVEMQGKFVKL